MYIGVLFITLRTHLSALTIFSHRYTYYFTNKTKAIRVHTTAQPLSNPCLHHPHFPTVRQLSSDTTQSQARAFCIKVVQKKDQPLLALQHSQSEGLHHHPLRVKAIKGKSHVQAMKVHKVVQRYSYNRAICAKYLWTLFRTRLTLN